MTGGSGFSAGYVRRADASGILLMLGATLFFVATNVFVKFLAAEDMSVFQITWGRMVFHWLAFLPLFLLPQYRGTIRPNRPRLQFYRSAILFFTNSLFFGDLNFPYPGDRRFDHVRRAAGRGDPEFPVPG